MSGERFDAFTQALASAPSRRQMLRLVAGGVLGGLATLVHSARAAAQSPCPPGSPPCPGVGSGCCPVIAGFTFVCCGKGCAAVSHGYFCCGTGVCGPGEVCCTNPTTGVQTCRSGLCGGDCVCGGGYRCCGDGFCHAGCCPGQTPCGSDCCSSEETCNSTSGVCCEAGTVPCGHVCCPTDQVCLNPHGVPGAGTCCPPGKVCGQNCCRGAFRCADPVIGACVAPRGLRQPCGTRRCPPNWRCCQPLEGEPHCCPPSKVCCGAGCCG